MLEQTPGQHGTQGKGQRTKRALKDTISKAADVFIGGFLIGNVLERDPASTGQGARHALGLYDQTCDAVDAICCLWEKRHISFDDRATIAVSEIKKIIGIQKRAFVCYNT